MAASALKTQSPANAPLYHANVEYTFTDYSLDGTPARGCANGAQEKFRLAVPRRRHVLSTVAELYGDPVREAVAELSASLAQNARSDLARSLRSLCGSNTDKFYRSDSDIAARLIASMWIAGVATKAISNSASLCEAERWFFGGDPSYALVGLLSGDSIASAEEALKSRSDASAYLELLPYILDPYGPGTRLSVRRDPTTRIARSSKRAGGVFYTPGDVAEYMAIACLDQLSADLPSTVFDPACGTGVFVRAAFRELRRRFPGRGALSLASEYLFGADIDPWAANATAFVLLVDILADTARQGLSPAGCWRRLRRNFVCIDTLRIDPDREESSRSVEHSDEGGRLPISRLFPALKGGSAIIFGNPPYADLGTRPDFAKIGTTFRTIAVKQQPGAEIYPAFVEQMIRLASSEECAGALVLPLSIACNIGPQFAAIRELIAATRGRWSFAFFDREPHALFGEDVKTRNAIVLWSRARSDTNTVLATGPLRKWRGDCRATMFKNLRFTAIDDDIRTGIPKVEGSSQASALKALSSRWTQLEQAVKGIGRQNLAASPNADEQTVFVGPTAYNFLNVFLRPPRTLFQNDLPLSQHPLHAISCTSREDARTIFALLSSHLAYWWWHANGDGFHVSGRFLSEFPFGVDALGGACGDTLSKLGDELWSKIQYSPIISLNRGRRSLAFTPNGHDQIRSRIDQALVDLAGLESAFVDELQQFTAHTVAAKLRVYTNSETDVQEKI